MKPKLSLKEICRGWGGEIKCYVGSIKLIVSLLVLKERFFLPWEVQNKIKNKEERIMIHHNTFLLSMILERFCIRVLEP